MNKRGLDDKRIILFVILFILIAITFMAYVLVKFSNNYDPIINQAISNSSMSLQDRCLTLKINPLNCTATQDKVSLSFELINGNFNELIATIIFDDGFAKSISAFTPSLSTKIDFLINKLPNQKPINAKALAIILDEQGNKITCVLPDEIICTLEFLNIDADRNITGGSGGEGDNDGGSGENPPPTVPNDPEILQGEGFYGMEIISANKNQENIIVTTTGATYILNENSIELYRRIDPKTNSINPRKVAQINFETPLGNLEINSKNKSQVIVSSSKTELTFNSDSLFFIKSKENLNYSHINLISSAPWNKGTKADKIWTDGYGGSLHANVTGNTKTTFSLDSTRFDTKSGDITSHMVFPPKLFNFEKLYGENARPHVYFISGENEMKNIASDFTSFVNNNYGVFILWASFYNTTDNYYESPELLSSGLMGYKFNNETLVNNFISQAHANNFKVITYISQPSGIITNRWIYPAGHPSGGKKQDINTTLNWMKSFQNEFNLNGWYLDNADAGDFIADYNFIKQLRKDIGDNGVIYHHDSVDIWGSWINSVEFDGLRSIFFNAYVDYTYTGETGYLAREVNDPNNLYLRFYSSGYGLSQAYGAYMRPSNQKAAIKEVEKNRVGVELHGTELNSILETINNAWNSHYKPFYELKKVEYLTGNFNPNPDWPINNQFGWFRDINGASINQINPNTIIISWETDDFSDSEVIYTDKSYEKWTYWFNNETSGRRYNSSLTKVHNITLSNIYQATQYKFRLRSNNNQSLTNEVIWGAVING